MLLAVTATSLQVSAQQTRNVQVSDSNGHVQYYDEAKVAAGQCPNPSGSTGFDDQNCATSIILAGDTITWTDASGITGDKHSATEGICNPICNFANTAPPPSAGAQYDIPGSAFNTLTPPSSSPSLFDQPGQSLSYKFDTSGPGVFPTW